MGLPDLPWSGPGHGAGPEDAVLEVVAEELRRHLGAPPPGELWIGDDAAILRSPGGALVAATDAVVEGVHADLALVGLDDLGWKAVTAAVSDLAAMGASPMYALVTYCQPPGTDAGLLTRGVAEAAVAYRCPVVGGDLSAARQLVVSVSVVGSLPAPEHARPGSGAREGGPGGARRVARPPGGVTRAGARSGDKVLVTGPCGGSAAGLRILAERAAAGHVAAGSRPETGDRAGEEALVRAHVRPQARVAEGRVARRAGASAMIDVSDGLALDLHRLAVASGVGLRLTEVPVAPGATEQEALGGGEDFQLLMTIGDSRALAADFVSAGLAPPIEIGDCTEDPSERMLAGDPFEISGWQHPI